MKPTHPTRPVSERFTHRQAASPARHARTIERSPRSSMNALLWILQVLLAGAFAAAGAMHLSKSKADLTPKFPVLEAYRALTIKAIGVAEVLGALGLVAAPLAGMSALVPWAALGLACIMIAAAMAHAERGEWKETAVPAALLVAAVLVVYGRTMLPA